MEILDGELGLAADDGFEDEQRKMFAERRFCSGLDCRIGLISLITVFQSWSVRHKAE